jgi:CDP-diglyceride synthetase
LQLQAALRTPNLFLWLSAFSGSDRWHILTFNSHPQTAGIDLAVSLSAVLFIAFLGVYIVRLRFLPDGFYWLLLAIAPAGISDIGAFLVGIATASTRWRRR